MSENWRLGLAFAAMVGLMLATSSWAQRYPCDVKAYPFAYGFKSFMGMCPRGCA